MNKQDRILLNNLLNAHDRLWDREIGVFDFYHLLFATSQTNAGRTFLPDAEKVAAQLLELIRSGKSKEDRLSVALELVDELLDQASIAVGEDEMANPKGRHDPPTLWGQP